MKLRNFYCSKYVHVLIKPKKNVALKLRKFKLKDQTLNRIRSKSNEEIKFKKSADKAVLRWKDQEKKTTITKFTQRTCQITKAY